MQNLKLSKVINVVEDGLLTLMATIFSSLDAFPSRRILILLHKKGQEDKMHWYVCIYPFCPIIDLLHFKHIKRIPSIIYQFEQTLLTIKCSMFLMIFWEITILSCHKRSSLSTNKAGSGLQLVTIGRMADFGTMVDGAVSAGSTLLDLMTFASVNLREKLVEAFTLKSKFFAHKIYNGQNLKQQVILLGIMQLSF